MAGTVLYCTRMRSVREYPWVAYNGSMVKPVRFLSMCREALILGATAYGGPAMLASLRSRFVDRNRFMTLREFYDDLAIAQLLPGSTSVSVLTAVGFSRRRLAGALLLPAFFLVPAFLLMLGLSWAYFRFGSAPATRTILSGFGPMVTALLVHATVRLAGPALAGRRVVDLRAVFLAFAAFVAVASGRVESVGVIVASGMFGVAFHYLSGGFLPKHAADGVGDRQSAVEQKVLRRRFSYPLWAIVAGFVLLAATVPTVARVSGTFLKIGTYAFGGGYAAIPLMKSLVVDRERWLTATEFADGIALGQITPGPVFITATFIGYRVGGLLGAIAATASVFAAPVAAMLLALVFHAKAAALSPVRAFTRGVVAGCIGLFAALTMQMAMHALTGPAPIGIFVASVTILFIGGNPALTLVPAVAVPIVMTAYGQ